jgi:hypothetical protein
MYVPPSEKKSISKKEEKLERKKRNIFTYLLNIYLGTGSSLLGSFFLFFIIFVIWGCGWYFLLKHVFPNDAIIEYQTATNGFGFIVGAIFYKWLQETMDDYMAPVKHLKDLLETIYFFSELFLIMPLYGEEETEKQEKGYKTKLYILLDSLLYYSLRLYIDHDNTEYQVVSDKITGITRNTIFVEYCGKKKEREFKTEREKIACISQVILHFILQLEKNQIIDQQQAKLLLQRHEKIHEKIILSDIGLEIIDPPYIYNHIIFVLLAYFSLIFPFGLYVGAPNFMPYVYPFLMVIFIGFYIIRKWLGDPLDESNPLGTRMYFNWRKQLRTRLYEKVYDTSHTGNGGISLFNSIFSLV